MLLQAQWPSAVFNIWVPLAAIRVKDNYLSKFVFYLLRSANVQDAIQISWTYGTQQTLGLKTLSNLKLPVPSKEEQFGIVTFIEGILPSLEASIEKSEISINLLSERRTALISAAVTGKIDVRHWQAPKEKPGHEAVA